MSPLLPFDELVIEQCDAERLSLGDGRRRAFRKKR